MNFTLKARLKDIIQVKIYLDASKLRFPKSIQIKREKESFKVGLVSGLWLNTFSLVSHHNANIIQELLKSPEPLIQLHPVVLA